MIGDQDLGEAGPHRLVTRCRLVPSHSPSELSGPRVKASSSIPFVALSQCASRPGLASHQPPMLFRTLEESLFETLLNRTRLRTGFCLPEYFLALPNGRGIISSSRSRSLTSRLSSSRWCLVNVDSGVCPDLAPKAEGDALPLWSEDLLHVHSRCAGGSNWQWGALAHITSSDAADILPRDSVEYECRFMSERSCLK